MKRETLWIKRVVFLIDYYYNNSYFSYLNNKVQVETTALPFCISLNIVRGFLGERLKIDKQLSVTTPVVLTPLGGGTTYLSVQITVCGFWHHESDSVIKLRK